MALAASFVAFATLADDDDKAHGVKKRELPVPQSCWRETCTESN